MSVLANAADPRVSTVLPSCAAPATLTFAGSTGTYCGALAGNDWTITAKGFAKTSVGSQQTRTITQVASIVSLVDGGLGELWNRVYQYDDGSCVEFKKITIVVPVVTRGCLKLSGNLDKPSRLLGSYVSIGGYVELKQHDSIGLSGAPIPKADIGGTCKLEARHGAAHALRARRRRLRERDHGDARRPRATHRRLRLLVRQRQAGAAVPVQRRLAARRE